VQLSCFDRLERFRDLATCYAKLTIATIISGSDELQNRP
jgi:hypothetical protein